MVLMLNRLIWRCIWLAWLGALVAVIYLSSGKAQGSDLVIGVAVLVAALLVATGGMVLQRSRARREQHQRTEAVRTRHAAQDRADYAASAEATRLSQDAPET
ncbi:MAG: hypothetical protein JO318_08040 [Chloroflexi bacterium]|nr:hypothetical protein [Chloroflexota bacterium]